MPEQATVSLRKETVGCPTTAKVHVKMAAQTGEVMSLSTAKPVKPVYSPGRKALTSAEAKLDLRGHKDHGYSWRKENFPAGSRNGPKTWEPGSTPRGVLTGGVPKMSVFSK